MSLGYIHCFLRCHGPKGCAIPLPHPNLLDTDENLRSLDKGAQSIVVVCPYCGLGSSYLERDVIHQVYADMPSLFQRDECVLVRGEIECGGSNCEAPKTIHAVQGVATGTWRPKAVAKDWKFSDSATCGAGHRLCFEESRGIHWVAQVGYPFQKRE